MRQERPSIRYLPLSLTPRQQTSRSPGSPRATRNHGGIHRLPHQHAGGLSGQTADCFDCHNGPRRDGSSPNTGRGSPASLTLPTHDPNGNLLPLRIVSQSRHGSLGLSTSVATYFPEPGFTGTDEITFAARDGASNSNRGTGTVSVAQGSLAISAVALVPPDYPAGWPAAFAVMGTPNKVLGTVSHDWDYGSGSTHGTDADEAHTCSAQGRSSPL